MRKPSAQSVQSERLRDMRPCGDTVNPDWGAFPKELRKPEKGSGMIDRNERRRARTRAEAKDKAEARARDAHCPNRCRLPFCPYCGLAKGQVSQVAHVEQAKGMGGDPQNFRSDASGLMLLCPLAHMAQERHEWTVEPLTTEGTNGPCAFYLLEDVYDKQSGDFSTRRLLWARERSIGVPEHAAPLVRFKPPRRTTEQD